MDRLFAQVSKETGCPVEKLTYSVDKYYTDFYTQPCRHLPERISVDACGTRKSYRHRGLSGNITNWLLGSWTSVK